MLVRQLFDEKTYTYTYLIADKKSKEAILIDPVIECLPLYKSLIHELDLSLRYAIDTHIHADHITALGVLREYYQCDTVHGQESEAKGISYPVGDSDILTLGDLTLTALHTPGHTNESYCFLLEDKQQSHAPGYIFTGDTLLIRGTGRTDFQQGCAKEQYYSIVEKLLVLDDSTIVYPGHDYKGVSHSTIGEEKHHNPRLQVSNVEEYEALMKGLNLAKPKYMDIALPRNLQVGTLS